MSGKQKLNITKLITLQRLGRHLGGGKNTDFALGGGGDFLF